MKRISPIEQLFCALILTLFFIGCAHTNTLSYVEKKWGPPAKIEKGDDTITYHYYFREGVLRKWVVYEFIADKDGTIKEKRKYLRQPKLE